MVHGGRVIVVFSVATTAYVFLTAPQEKLERLVYEEVGGFIGGGVVANLAASACLIFGIASGGWGLLACGILGGLGGDVVGTYAGNRLYYSRNPRIEQKIESAGVVDAAELTPYPPPAMCLVP